MQVSKATCFTEVMTELLKILSFSIYSLKLEDDNSVQPNSRNKQTTAKLHTLSTRIKLKCKHQILRRGAKVNETEISYPLLHTLDYEAQVFTHLLLAQVLLFTSLDVEKKTENI